MSAESRCRREGGARGAAAADRTVAPTRALVRAIHGGAAGPAARRHRRLAVQLPFITPPCGGGSASRLHRGPLQDAFERATLGDACGRTAGTGASSTASSTRPSGQQSSLAEARLPPDVRVEFAVAGGRRDVKWADVRDGRNHSTLRLHFGAWAIGNPHLEARRARVDPGRGPARSPPPPVPTRVRWISSRRQALPSPAGARARSRSVEKVSTGTDTPLVVKRLDLKVRKAASTHDRHQQGGPPRWRSRTAGVGDDRSRAALGVRPRPLRLLQLGDDTYFDNLKSRALSQSSILRYSYRRREVLSWRTVSSLPGAR